MCVSCVCRKNSLSVLCVFVFLPSNFCKSVVCVYLLPCFAAKSLLSNFCKCVVCVCLSCVCHCVCVDFLVAKLLRLHFMFCMILFDTCFALVRPALVVLFVSSHVPILVGNETDKMGRSLCVSCAFVVFCCRQISYVSYVFTAKFL